ncbi:MAG: YcxB family protein [Pirellulaceae bacterium]
MKASYELFPDDLAAFIEFHQRTSPVARNQRLGCFGMALVALLVLPLGIVLTTDKPRIQTAIDIWPLFLGPILLVLFVMPYVRWGTRQMSRRLLSEGTNAGFYGECDLAIDADGLTESRPSGSTTRRWSSVERIATTPRYLFVYTSGIEAFVVPRRAFHTEPEFNEFANVIASRSGATIDRL